MQTLEAAIIEHPFFNGLRPEWLHQIATCAFNRHYDAGDDILREGGEAREIYLIREGNVALEACVSGRGPVPLQTLGPGDVLGWSWLIPPYAWAFNARAETRVRTIALDGTALRALCEANPALGYEMMKRFAAILVQRLQATRMSWLAGSKQVG